MKNERNETVHSIRGINLGKNWFDVGGIDTHGKLIFRKKLNRKQLLELAATLPACTVIIVSPGLSSGDGCSPATAIRHASSPPSLSNRT